MEKKLGVCSKTFRSSTKSVPVPTLFHMVEDSTWKTASIRPHLLHVTLFVMVMGMEITLFWKMNTPEPEWWYMARVRFALQAHFSSNLAENMLDFTSDYFAAGNSQDLGIHVPPLPTQLQFTLTDCTVCICLQFRAIPLLIMILHHVSEQTHLFHCTGLLA